MSDIPELKLRAKALVADCGAHMSEAEDRPDGVKDMANIQEAVGLAVQIIVDVASELQEQFKHEL